jgi:hypothetical protein
VNKLILFLILSLTSGVTAQSKENQKIKYNLSICSIIKNESKFLKEWIEYHSLIGVNHFYLYNIESSDNYREVLKPYLKSKIVTLIQWPNLSKNFISNDLLMLGTRIPAYENAAKFLAFEESEWLTFVDVDEFLVSPNNESLEKILKKYENYPGVILSSEFFNASSIGELPQKKLIIENTQITSPPKRNQSLKIEKTIFKPKKTLGFTWPPYKFEFVDEQEAYTVKTSEVKINNYVYKNTKSFLNGKVKDRIEVDQRFLADNEKKQLLERYEINDREQAIIRYVPELRKRMGLSNAFD